MTPSEAAGRLHLSPEGAQAFAELCEKGCDPGVLCGLLIHLTAPPVTLSRRVVQDHSEVVEAIPGKDPLGLDPFYQHVVEEAQTGAPVPNMPRTDSGDLVNPRLTRSGLEVTGGFGQIPETALPAFARLEGRPTTAESSNSDPRAPGSKPCRRSERPFKTRELKTLSRQLKTAAADIRHLSTGGAARRALPRYGSPVLALTLPDRLTAYAEHVIPVLLGMAPVREAKKEPATAIRVSLRPLDSLDEALGMFEVRELRPLQKRFTRLAGRLRGLHDTSAGEIIEDRFPVFEDVPNQLDAFSGKVLSTIRELRVGPKQRPDFTRRLWRLCQYVCEQTGTYHDRLVAEVLSAVGVKLGRGELDEFALRKWRGQHPRRS